ncbi:hypothetical protein ACS0TY_028674 [Phlomoides rotata]
MRFEESGPVAHTFVAFGGGLRMCPRKEYGRLEGLVFMHRQEYHVSYMRRFHARLAQKRQKLI